MQKNTSKSKNNLTIQLDNNAFGFTLFEHSIIMPLALQSLPIPL